MFKNNKFKKDFRIKAFLVQIFLNQNKRIQIKSTNKYLNNLYSEKVLKFKNYFQLNKFHYQN